jgi:hypothetical protein
MSRFPICVVLAVACLTPPLPGAEPGSGSQSGTVRLASGLTAHYAYYSDRNALRDGRRSRDAVIALTESGNLLRLDLATLKPTRDWAGPVPAVCLGRGDEGGVLAGFKDGRVCRIDPTTLALTEVARLPGEIQWVGTMSDGAHEPGKSRLIAVVGQTNPVVHDLGSGKAYPFGRRASAFLLDRKQRLWLGADDGEWGGWCSYVDLQAGQVHPVAGPKKPGPRGGNRWSGIFGFTELRDGQVWAYGGTTHMGITEGFLCRVDQGQAEALYQADNSALLRFQRAEAEKAMEEEQRKEAEIERNQRELAGPRPKAKDVAEPQPRAKPPENPLPVDRPRLPITHVVEDSRTGTILVVAFSDIYRTNTRLARWAKVHELDIGYRWGRRDAMGAYPSICSVLPIEEPGKPFGLVFGTRLDGFVRLIDGKETHHELPGQLSAGEVKRIEDSSEGILAVDESDENDHEYWRFRDGAWGAVSFAPPCQPLPHAPDFEGAPDAEAWDKTITLVGRDRSIVTVSATDELPGTRTTSRWRAGKAEVLGRELSRLNPSGCFLTPDGRLWNADRGILQHFVDGRWTVAATYIETRGLVDARARIGVGYGLRAVNDGGPPWILLDGYRGQLLRLSHGPGFKDPRLNSVPLSEAGEPLKIRDAISWTKAELMLATDRGLKLLALDGDKLAAAPINTGGRSISRIRRDGRGRLWLGGDGLAVVEAGGTVVHSLDDLPMLGRAKVDAIAADPDHPDGVIAALGEHGVVFVRVDGN